MQRDELIEVVRFELDAMQTTAQELAVLLSDVQERDPTLREKTAAGAFLAQFYTGVENILKRISRYHGIPLPHGDTWHLDLFQRFREPGKPPLPVLLDEALASDLGPYRRFRHVVHHGYGFELEWERMQEGVRRVGSVFERFRRQVEAYLERVS